MALKTYLLCACVVFALPEVVKSEDLMVGTTVNGVLAYTENVDLSAIPLKTRTKNVFFNSNSSTIRGIFCVDQDKSTASPIITAGGVGSTFVNIRLRSERGDGLHYQVQVYV